MAKPADIKSNRSKIAIALSARAAAALITWGASSRGKDGPIGKAALQEATALVAFGPRPSGSEAHRKMESYITDKLRSAGLSVEEDRFTADTPDGSVPMNNIIGRIPSSGGDSQRTIILATHYDTKPEKNFKFVGANDGASGTGLLLVLAPILAKKSFHHNILLVFLDGEEAFHEWTDTDSVYGSRHFAEQLTASGKASQVGAFILLDMIGDADLDIHRDGNSTPWLRDMVWKAADRLGYSRYFLNTSAAYEDDHIPFIKAGIPSVDIIDLNYGPWHTANDTIDKLSSGSLQVVAEVTQASLSDLDGGK